MQDIAVDYRKDRIYLPHDQLAAHHVSETQIAQGDTRGLWHMMMHKQIERARKLLQAGAPIGRALKGRIGVELRVTILGGETILRKLHADPGCVFQNRPVLTRKELGRHARARDLLNMDVHQYCQDRAAASGSSFYYSFVFLPPHTRRAIIAFYALCRELDDVVDECHERQVAEAKLDWWRGEIARFAAGVPEHPAPRALFDTPQGRNAPAALLLETIDGMAMDLDYQRYPDFKSLNL